jgi:hypothetical protein
MGGIAQFTRMLGRTPSDGLVAAYREGFTPPARDCQIAVCAILASQRAARIHRTLEAGTACHEALLESEETLWLSRQHAQTACRNVGIDYDNLGEA